MPPEVAAKTAGSGGQDCDTRLQVYCIMFSQLEPGLPMLFTGTAIAAAARETRAGLNAPSRVAADAGRNSILACLPTLFHVTLYSKISRMRLSFLIRVLRKDGRSHLHFFFLSSAR